MESRTKLGPLSGMLYVAKDIIDAAGYATTGGTPALVGTTVTRDASVVTRMRSAGALLVGKTNLHELSFGITSNNSYFGAVANPLDISRIAGGSSGGSAVAVAIGLVPIALAADTGGSARIPAALCGIIGFRPTAGRYPMDGVLPISPTRDTVGVFANTVVDVVSVDAALSLVAVRSSSFPLSGSRIGRISRFAGPIDSAVGHAYTTVLASLQAAGAILVDVDLSALFGTANEIGLPIALYEFPQALQAYLNSSRVDVSADEIGASIASADVRDIWSAATSPGIDRAVYAAAMARRDKLAEGYLSVLDNAAIEFVAYPTTPVTARPIGDDETVHVGSERVGTFATYTRFANLGGLVGSPSITLPAGSDELGLPIGIEFATARGNDARLLDFAAAAERLLNTLNKSQAVNLGGTTERSAS
jgi:mandelamide amidase